MNNLQDFESYKKAKLANEASMELALSSNDLRNKALAAMAKALLDNTDEILRANAEDLKAAKENNTASALIDRLTLTIERLSGMADALIALSAQADPIGKLIEGRTLYNGIKLQKVSVPLGVVGIIYEARPNVTADVCGLCIKSANACVLKGGSSAKNSNLAIANILRQAISLVGLNQDCIQMIESCDRQETNALMQTTEFIDVIIPRGGAGLINACVQNSKVPIIQTGLGNCHTYIEASASESMAKEIVVNAKTQRPGVCNACETLLVDSSFAHKGECFINILKALKDKNVVLHLCSESANIADDAGISYIEANDEDWDREYLDYELAIKIVDNCAQAIKHINEHSTGHSECIITNNYEVAQLFVNKINSACVYVNASTRVSEGGEFGLGAEVGISTQKLHARGPFGVDALTSSKYILFGDGQIRQ
ncbi:MAG: glutamate-5-semialdehyde dehydrogenase [Coriobacteriales bacterium]|nr:glutamate-5-semialdehyde dehydrogenase [Coriobacteriales bacterium]